MQHTKAAYVGRLLSALTGLISLFSIFRVIFML